MKTVAKKKKKRFLYFVFLLNNRDTQYTTNSLGNFAAQNKNLYSSFFVFIVDCADVEITISDVEYFQSELDKERFRTL